MSLRDQLGRRIGPGIWEDVEGNIHFSIPELIQEFDLPDTPEVRERVTRELREIITSAFPGDKVIYREQPDGASDVR